MSEELKSTQIYYGENVLMMRVDDCLIFGNKDALRRLAEKLKERTAKVEGNRCSACDNHIRPCMKYCDYCGARLEWE